MMPMKPLRGISSWWCTAALLFCLFTPYLFFSFGRNPYPDWIAFVFHSPAGTILCLALIVNLFAASVRIIVRRTSRPAVTPESIRAMDIHESVPVPDDRAREMVAGWLEGKGMSRTIGEAGIRRVTGRFSFLPGTLFRLGIILTLGAAIVSVQGRRASEAVLHEGERRELPGAALTVAAIHANLPEDFLQVGDESLFQLEGVGASLAASGKSYDITPGFPRRIGGQYYRIVHLGYTQALAVEGPGLRVERREDLDVLPPGKTAVVSLPTGTAFLTFTLEPERTIAKGLVKGRQYNLTAPQYRIVAQKGGAREKPEGNVVRPGGHAEFGALRVSLGKQSPFIRVLIVADPALPCIYAGGLLTLVAVLFMLCRFFWYERELAAVMQGGTLLIGYREEFFKKWGIERFLLQLGSLPQGGD